MSNNRALTPAEVAASVSDIKSYDPGLGAYNFQDLGAVVKFGDVMSKAGEMLPDHLRNKPALCMAVTMRATHWGFDPFALAMETYQAKQGGPIGYQAKVFTAALLNAGVKLRYRYEGKITILDKPVKSARGNQVAARTATGDRKCIAYADVDGEVLEFETMTLDQITIKNSPLWHNDPDSQLAYSAGRGWARRYRSDVIMGAYSADEVEEMKPMRDVTPESKPDGFAARAQRARQQEAAPAQEAEKDQPIEGEILPDDGEAAPVEQESQEGGGAQERTFEVDEGATAFKDGKAASECPHPNDPQHRDWMRGWSEAYEAQAAVEGGEA
jgi:ribosome modulation factor